MSRCPKFQGKTPRFKRQHAWESSRIRGTPEPPTPYIVELAFPHLTFEAPVTITSAPNTKRLFVVQATGKTFSFPDDPSCTTLDLFVDFGTTLSNFDRVYGMTFHPEFPNSPCVYVCNILTGDTPDRSVIERFTVINRDPPRVDPSNHHEIFRWLAGGHNGCCLKFGADGYLYFSTGDGKSPNPPDELRVGQDVGNVLSCVLRIDVDQVEDGRNYAIPKDNPFVDLQGARPEIWAYGFRNPWKMSFDRLTDDLWVGDVGWESSEMIYQVQRGGNYVWSITEGSQSVHPTDKRGPTPILPPVTEHDHTEAARSPAATFIVKSNILTSKEYISMVIIPAERFGDSAMMVFK